MVVVRVRFRVRVIMRIIHYAYWWGQTVLMAAGHLINCVPGAYLGSRVYITVAKAPMSNWAETFGYYILIMTKKNTLFTSIVLTIMK